MAGATPRKRRRPMPDDSSTTPADSGGIWRGLRALLFGDEADETLRTRLEEVIDEHEGEPGPDAKGDLSPLERPMVRHQIGRAPVCTPVTNAHIVCRLLLEKQ